MNIKDLPKQQRKVFEFIRDFISKKRYAPSVREIADHIGGSSPNGVICHLDALTAKGFIGREPNISRALWIEYEG